MSVEMDHVEAQHFYAGLSNQPGNVGYPVQQNLPHVVSSWSDLAQGTNDLTDYGSYGLIVVFTGQNTSTNAMTALIDIGIGPTLVQSDIQMIISGILFENTRYNNQSYNLFFPIEIPAGNRLFGRIRHTAPTGTGYVKTYVIPVMCPTPRDRYLSDCETIGIDTTDGVGASSGRNDTGGSTVDPGATINTFGAWKELTPGTTHPFRHAMMIMAYLLNTQSGVYNWRIQVGIGATGQEQVVWDGIVMSSNTITDKPYPFYWNAPLCGPAGSRVSVRASSDGNDATDRLFQVAMYLFRDG